jgi:S1-C subfamily serine protease
MDLERLNKTQIILLTLLVSFVTSIATGIATVSLMEKAPTDVTRVISRIVEKPIETITSGGTIIEERTVVVSEGERIAEAVKRAVPSIVRLYTVSGKDELEFKGMGVIVSSDGIVVADSRIVDTRERYAVTLSDGTRFPAEPSDVETEQGFLRIDPEGSGKVFTPGTFTPFDALV